MFTCRNAEPSVIVLGKRCIWRFLLIFPFFFPPLSPCAFEQVGNVLGLHLPFSGIRNEGFLGRDFHIELYFLKRNPAIRSTQSTEHLLRSCYHLLVCTAQPGTFRPASYSTLRIMGVGGSGQEINYLAWFAGCKGQGQNLNLGLSLSKLGALCLFLPAAGGVSSVLRSRATWAFVERGSFWALVTQIPLESLHHQWDQGWDT